MSDNYTHRGITVGNKVVVFRVNPESAADTPLSDTEVNYHLLADRIEELEAKLAKLEPRLCDAAASETGKCDKCNNTGKLPATHVMVPVEPTEKMCNLGYDVGSDLVVNRHEPTFVDGDEVEIYKAMIQAAQEGG